MVCCCGCCFLPQNAQQSKRETASEPVAPVLLPVPWSSYCTGHMRLQGCHVSSASAASHAMKLMEPVKPGNMSVASAICGCAGVQLADCCTQACCCCCCFGCDCFEVWLAAMAGTIAYLPLCDFEGTLVLSDLQQLNNSLLIWGKTSHLTHYVTDELDLLA